MINNISTSTCTWSSVLKHCTIYTIEINFVTNGTYQDFYISKDMICSEMLEFLSFKKRIWKMCSPRKIFLSVWRLLWHMFLLELFIQSSQLQIRFISIIVSSILAGSSKCTSRCVDEKYNQSVNTFKSSCLCVYIPYMPDCSLYNIIIIKMSCNKQKGTFQI